MQLIIKFLLILSLLGVGIMVALRYPISPEAQEEAEKTTPKELTCDADAITQEDYENLTLSGEFLEKQATQFETQKKYSLAIHKYNEAIAAYFKASKLPRESRTFEDIAELKQTHPKIMEKSARLLVQLGRTYTKLHKYENAADCFSMAIRFRIDKPNDAIAYLNRGDAYQRLGDRVKALEDFTTASDLFKEYKLLSYQKIADNRIKSLSSPTPTKSNH